MFRRHFWVFAVVAILCSSCFERVPTTELAPVSSGMAKIRPSYVVKQGDTLFSIAWKFDKDYKALAYYNHINSDANLKIGQKISLVDQAFHTRTAKFKSMTHSRGKSQPKPLMHKNKVAVKKKRSVSIGPTQGAQWYWPAKGKLSKNFILAKQQKGIDIQGTVGSPVLAAKSGIVAYSGNGLRGYGNLVILRHSNNFLSAYAFNRKIIVKEGQKVKAKQKIAEMGVRKGHKGLLHFEIRKKGRPINPLKYLIKH